jgi:uncharacterized membrane protein YeaQ/YmgE (transglycosylase-associated protein family)
MDLTYEASVLTPGEVTSWLVMGLIAGWLAGVVMKRGESGDLGDLIMGLTGSFLGGVITSFVVEGPARFWCGIVVALLGACVLIVLLRQISKRQTVWRL